MKCPHCKKETPVARACIHCDGRLKLTRKQVLKLAREEALREQEEYTAKQVRKWLIFACLLFGIALSAFIVTRGSVSPRVIPSYPYANPPAEAHTDLPVDGLRASTDDDAEAQPSGPRVFIEMKPEELVGTFPRFVRTDDEVERDNDDE